MAGRGRFGKKSVGSKVVEFPSGANSGDIAIDDVKDNSISDSTDVAENPNAESDLNAVVVRGEFIDVIRQIGDNINQISNYLMEDINTLYGQHVFPFQIQVSVLEELLIDKDIITRSELDTRYHNKLKEMQDKARAIKEDSDGGRLATKEEDEQMNKEKILETLNNK